MPAQVQQDLRPNSSLQTFNNKLDKEQDLITGERTVDNGQITKNSPASQQPTKKLEIDTDVKVDRFIKDNKLQLAMIRSLEVAKKSKTGTSETRTAKKVTEVERDLSDLKKGKFYQQLTQQSNQRFEASAKEKIVPNLPETDWITRPELNLKLALDQTQGDQRANVEMKVVYPGENYRPASIIKENDSDNFYSRELELKAVNYAETEKEREDLNYKLRGLLPQAEIRAKPFEPLLEPLDLLISDWSRSRDKEEFYTANKRDNSVSSIVQQIPATDLGPIKQQERWTGDNSGIILDYDLNSSDNEDKVEKRLLYRNGERSQSLLSSLEATEIDFNVEYSTEFDAMYVNAIDGVEERDGRFLEFYRNGQIMQNSVDNEEVEPGDLVEARLSEEQNCYNEEMNAQNTLKSINHLEKGSISTELAL